MVFWNGGWIIDSYGAVNVLSLSKAMALNPACFKALNGKSLTSSFGGFKSI